MLQDKRKDLDFERQKRIAQRMVEDLAASGQDIYYLPTAQVALLLREQIARGGGLGAEDRNLMQRLGQREIEFLLSHR